MKIAYLLTFLLVACLSPFLGFAQKPKPKNDVIVKIDNSRIPCRIVGVGLDEVVYRNTNRNATIH